MYIEKLVANRDGFEVSGLQIDKDEVEAFKNLVNSLQQTVSLLRETPSV